MVVPNGKVAPEVGAQVGVIAPSTRSVAETWKLTAAPIALVASAVMLAGTVRAGAVLSWTVTVKVLALLVLPVESFAVQDTVVMPSAKVAPEAGVQFTTGDGSTRSAAVAVKVTAAPAALVASAVMSAGTVSVGGVVS